MRKINVLTFVTMDGVMQGPGGPEEDPGGGFKHGGWSVGYFDEAVGQEMGKEMGEPFDLLLGRRTYDIFASHWPRATDPIADVINRATKYVATNHPLSTDWSQTAVRLDTDVVEAIRKLKGGTGGYARYIAICPPDWKFGANIGPTDAPLPKSPRLLHWDDKSGTRMR